MEMDMWNHGWNEMMTQIAGRRVRKGGQRIHEAQRRAGNLLLEGLDVGLRQTQNLATDIANVYATSRSCMAD